MERRKPVLHCIHFPLPAKPLKVLFAGPAPIIIIVLLHRYLPPNIMKITARYKQKEHRKNQKYPPSFFITDDSQRYEQWADIDKNMNKDCRHEQKLSYHLYRCKETKYMSHSAPFQSKPIWKNSRISIASPLAHVSPRIWRSVSNTFFRIASLSVNLNCQDDTITICTTKIPTPIHARCFPALLPTPFSIKSPRFHES